MPFLSRRPVKNTPTEEVDVEMVHGLSRPRTVIDHSAVTFSIEASFPSHLSRHNEEVAQ